MRVFWPATEQDARYRERRILAVITRRRAWIIPTGRWRPMSQEDIEDMLLAERQAFAEGGF